MKKLIIIFALLICYNVNAQWSAAAIKLGSFSPGSTDAGFIIGMPGIHPKIASMQNITPKEHYQKEAVRVDEIVRIIERQGPTPKFRSIV